MARGPEAPHRTRSTAVRDDVGGIEDEGVRLARRQRGQLETLRRPGGGGGAGGRGGGALRGPEGDRRADRAGAPGDPVDERRGLLRYRVERVLNRAIPLRQEEPRDPR